MAKNLFLHKNKIQMYAIYAPYAVYLKITSHFRLKKLFCYYPRAAPILNSNKVINFPVSILPTASFKGTIINIKIDGAARRGWG